MLLYGHIAPWKSLSKPKFVTTQK